LLNGSSKACKQILRSSHRTINRNVHKLKQLKMTYPRLFWKCINGNKISSSSASLNDLEMHFRNIISKNVN